MRKRRKADLEGDNLATILSEESKGVHPQIKVVIKALNDPKELCCRRY